MKEIEKQQEEAKNNPGKCNGCVFCCCCKLAGVRVLIPVNCKKISLGITKEEKKKIIEACWKKKKSLQDWMKVALAQYGEYKTCEALQRTFRNETGLLLTGFMEDSLLKIATGQKANEQKKGETKNFSEEVWI